MSRLIVGHVDHKSARIWVRGSETCSIADVEVEDTNGGKTHTKSLDLEARHFYTGVVPITGLEPETDYRCKVVYRGTEDSTLRLVPKFGAGSFRTPPTPDTQTNFSFLLISCNLHSLGVVTAPDAAYRKLSAVAKQKKVGLVIHAGDQIYFDVPRWGRHPDIDDYRKTYLDAWEDCEPAAEFLTELPHYMILDDHEVIDGFANDVELPSGAPNYLQLALGTKVYREFQHIHNPESFGSNPLYYKFEIGAARFFVLDTRTERYLQKPGNQMISAEQFGRLRTWLKANKDHQLFIVTSTPFVANVRQSEDKWSSEPYRWQREKILEVIWKNDIRRVCFLTGDMHNSHHGTLTLSGADRSGIVVHELMSSPVNQLQKSRISKYAFGTEAPVDDKLSFRYASNIDKKEFYTGHSNALLVNVKASKVEFEVHRTKKSAIKAEMTGSFKF